MWLGPAALLLALLPALYAVMQAPDGLHYLGFEYNTDDHMVYAAWMRQAMEGRLLMDNRFTTEPQPSLTIHLYFFLLGQIARLVGIPLAAGLGRIVCGAAFFLLLKRFVGHLRLKRGAHLLAMILATFGGGVGFAVWQMFGTTISKPFPDLYKALLMGNLPVDVWQPEAFVFPSLLTNGLFMASLCLILLTYESFLKCRRRWTAVGAGFLSIGVLMNIHSYDVLTVGLVMVGLLAASVARGKVTGSWLGRSLLLTCGVLAPALWFFHVLQSDPVFQSRAATETYSPNFRAVLFGYLPLIVLGLLGAWKRASAEEDPRLRNRRLGGVGLATGVLLALSIGASWHTGGYFLSPLTWGLAFLAMIGACVLWSDERSSWNLIFAWAAVGMIAIYFPGLFQRKLTMGLSIPWAILAAYGLTSALANRDPGFRRLCVALALLVTCASSGLWILRDLAYVNGNVSNTTRHPVYLPSDVTAILDVLNRQPGRKVVLAIPGAGSPSVDSEGKLIPDSFGSPALSDLAPIITGLTGAYSYAGHWSETPEYTKRAADMYRFFLTKPVGGVRRVMDPGERSEFIRRTGATFAVMPMPTGVALPVMSPSELGKIVYQGKVWVLVRLRS